jgi:hypothetical protein
MYGFSSSFQGQDAEQELALEIEILKDLSPSDALADAVKGGDTTGGRGCENGTG